MLTYLHVKNIALIEELEAEFDEGLNILTGETGAGKSIIIGSIDAVLGQKVSKDFIRKGAEFALIELVFQVTDPLLLQILRDMDITVEDELIISRKISANGRSVFKINGETLSNQMLRDVTGLLIDLHSQHEHQSLLEKKNHMRLLDRYVYKSLETPIKTLKEHLKKYNALKSESKDYQMDSSIRKREMDFLQFEVDELLEADLKAGEDVQLEALYKKQSHTQQIQKNLSEIHDMLSGDGYTDGAISLVGKAMDKLQPIRSYDPLLNDYTGQLVQIEELIHDLNRSLLNYVDDLAVDEQLLDECRERLDFINRLKMKHGNTIDDILAVLSEKQSKLDHLVHFEERLLSIQTEMASLEARILQVCASLSEIRREGKNDLTDKIMSALSDLNLKNTRFEIRITQKETFTSEGIDDVEFMIATNTGEGLKPLVQIASGGELSRVMLAIKSVLADCDDIGTLIFDEIDTGISGRTAQMVAEKMVNLSRSRQILCITHLPQIAAMADHHFVIEKISDGSRTTTGMKRLKTDADVTEELARLLGGAKITETVRTSAFEMKKLANDMKAESL